MIPDIGPVKIPSRIMNMDSGIPVCLKRMCPRTLIMIATPKISRAPSITATLTYR
ncbi:MAG: hypothetical protein ACLFVP_05360 [Candidatus Bathyarchaeia archaeon]